MTLDEFSYTHNDLIFVLKPYQETDKSFSTHCSLNAVAKPDEQISSDAHGIQFSANNKEKINVAVAEENKDLGGLEKQGFDKALRSLWNDARSKGLFRYTFHELPSKVLPGKYQFIAQLNPDRAVKRRKPQTIQSPNQPFNPNEFNFNKVGQDEFLLKLKPWWSEMHEDVISTSGDMNLREADDPLILNEDVDVDEKTDGETDGEEIEHFLLINVSPLEYGHVLLTPFLKQNQPQKITFDGLRMAVEMVLLNASSDFRVGFNSLCGYASVNHHHYHAYYLKHRLYIEYAELHSVMGPCREIQNYPAAGFAFVLLQVDIDSLESFIRNAFKLVSYLQETNVAHNVFITRGSSQSSYGTFDALRLFIWARESSFGTKECEAFNPALCELGGHFPIKNELSYELLTEDFVSHELERICRETFTNIRQAVVSLYEDDSVNDFPLQSSVK